MTGLFVRELPERLRSRLQSGASAFSGKRRIAPASRTLRLLGHPSHGNDYRGNASFPWIAIARTRLSLVDVSTRDRALPYCVRVPPAIALDRSVSRLARPHR